MTASVKIMLSYDYNHFEICLGDDDIGYGNDTIMHNANELRKKVQRLADEAVRQYKVAKEKAADRLGLHGEYQVLQRECYLIRQTPESERTPIQKGTLKALEDFDWTRGQRYDYQDDWDYLHYQEGD